MAAHVLLWTIIQRALFTWQMSLWELGLQSPACTRTSYKRLRAEFQNACLIYGRVRKRTVITLDHRAVLVLKNSIPAAHQAGLANLMTAGVLSQVVEGRAVGAFLHFQKGRRRVLACGVTVRSLALSAASAQSAQPCLLQASMWV